jgi:hypothetical protein
MDNGRIPDTGISNTYEGGAGSAIGVDSGPYDLVLSYRFLSKKRSLDLFRLMWWISYLGFQYDVVARQPSVWICHLLNL